jgi:hypothetical protein
LQALSFAAIAVEAQRLQIVQSIRSALRDRKYVVHFEFHSGATADAASVSVSFENKEPFPHGKSFAPFGLPRGFRTYCRVSKLFVACCTGSSRREKSLLPTTEPATEGVVRNRVSERRKLGAKRTTSMLFECLSPKLDQN